MGVKTYLGNYFKISFRSWNFILGILTSLIDVKLSKTTSKVMLKC